MHMCIYVLYACVNNVACGVYDYWIQTSTTVSTPNFINDDVSGECAKGPGAYKDETLQTV